jgi:6-phosphogluconolactonase
VPPEHADSNFRLVQEELINPLGLPQGNIHRIKVELESPEKVAAEYEAELADFFRLQAGEVPTFDLILLGMGADGHTASLFPSDSSLQERERLVTAIRSIHGGFRRVTLTLPTINHARKVFFLVVGPDKAETVREVLQGSRQGVPLPAQLIELSDGELRFYLDKGAASRL